MNDLSAMDDRPAMNDLPALSDSAATNDQYSTWRFPGLACPTSSYAFFQSVMWKLVKGFDLTEFTKEQDDIYSGLQTFVMGFLSHNPKTVATDSPTSQDALRLEVDSLHKQYLASNPPNSDEVGEREFCLDMAVLGPHSDNEELLRESIRQLEYRFEITDRAQDYVDSLGIGRPQNLSIRDMYVADFDRLAREIDQDRYEHLVADISESEMIDSLFPDFNSRRPFLFYEKGWAYLRAALFLTKVPELEWKARIKVLIEEVEKHIEEVTEKLRSEPVIEAQLRKLFAKVPVGQSTAGS